MPGPVPRVAPDLFESGLTLGCDVSPLRGGQRTGSTPKGFNPKVPRVAPDLFESGLTLGCDVSPLRGGKGARPTPKGFNTTAQGKGRLAERARRPGRWCTDQPPNPEGVAQSALPLRSRSWNRPPTPLEDV